MLDEISISLSKELIDFNKGLSNSLKTSVKGYEGILEYVHNTKGKQIRPIIGILVSKMLGDFSNQQNIFLQAVELIHNATLFHDDIIDNADTRRNKPSLNKEFSNKIAVLTGDYFLTCAIKNIYAVNNAQITSLFADYMKKICEGEIEQNLSLYDIPSIEKYIDKTKRKTALLFSLTIQGSGLLSKNTEIAENLKIFGENLGIIYQIRDDINNFMEYDNKPVLNDLKSGVITAPIIFLAEEKNNINELISQKNYDKIFSLLKKSNAIEKTKCLLKKYYDAALLSSEKFPQNKYKEMLLDLLAKLGK